MNGQERFLKVLPKHIRIYEKVTKETMDRFYAQNNGVFTTEEENTMLMAVVSFLVSKLHDIEIDSIRHGVLTEQDYGRESDDNTLGESLTKLSGAFTGLIMASYDKAVEQNGHALEKMTDEDAVRTEVSYADLTEEYSQSRVLIDDEINAEAQRYVDGILEENAKLNAEIADREHSHMALYNENKELRKILEFYANEDNYDRIRIYDKHGEFNGSKAEYDCGKLARSLIGGRQHDGNRT